MEKIRLGYFADGPWAHRAFEKLVGDTSVEFGFIIPRFNTSDQVLKGLASEYDIPYYTNTKINSPDFLSTIGGHGCDLFVSMSFDQIFKKNVIDFPPLGTINCHAGKLPFYRGRNILNWVLINDEKEFGITVHHIDEGIDTGDIILQRTFPITDDDDYQSLLNRSYVECASILFDAIKLIQSGKYELISQKSIHPVGFYCGQRAAGDEIINWDQSSRDIFNFIRALTTPGPKAHTYFDGEIIKINKAKMVDKAPEYKSINGQVVGKTEKGILVKTSNSIIEILEIEFTGKLRIGDRLGT